MKKKVISCVMSAAMLMAAVSGAGAAQGSAVAYAEEDPGTQVTQTTGQSGTQDPAVVDDNDADTSGGSGEGITDDQSTAGDNTGSGGTGDQTSGDTAGSGQTGGDTSGDSQTGDETKTDDGKTEEGTGESGSGEENPADRISFTDVQDESAYYYAPVYWAVDRKITEGVGNDLFAPDGDCTRAQIVTFLWRAAGEPEPASSANPFTDVKEDAYYYKAVLWAVEQKITQGMTEDTFAPDGICTRAQSVTFLYRQAGADVKGTDSFEDVKEDGWYFDAVSWAVQQGITNGTSDTTFSPDSKCTRGQIVTFLYRAMMTPEDAADEDGVKGTFTIEDKDGQKGTFAVKASSVSSEKGIRDVRATVTDKDGDVRWYTLTQGSGGVYSVVVDITARSGFGSYTVDWYIVTGEDKMLHMDTQNVTLEAVNYAHAEDIGNRQFKIIIEGVDKNEKEASALVWSEAKGNDDQKWIALEKKSDTVWEGVVNCMDFKDSGTFLANLFLSSTNLGLISFDVPDSYLQLTIPEQLTAATDKVYSEVGRDLRACFDYSVAIKYNRNTPEVPEGYTKSQWYALYGFNYNTGTYNVQAATFCWLAKNLGYDAYYVEGAIPTSTGTLIDHAWTEIVIDGTTYVFDPNFTSETGKNGYRITYGTAGSWKYTRYTRQD